MSQTMKFLKRATVIRSENLRINYVQRLTMEIIDEDDEDEDEEEGKNERQN